MERALKITPLNSWHRANGANMANFGGFDMPLWYGTGVKLEHLAVVESAGIFDTSHMACVMVTGREALKLLQLCHTRDLATLKDGRCLYGALLNDNGHIIDDAIIYRFDHLHYMVCVNAGMGGVVTSHFNASSRRVKPDHHSGDTKIDVSATDLSEKVGKIDIQGRNSARILKKILDNPDPLFEKMAYFSFKGDLGKESEVKLKSGTPLLLSRSGYTGEFGFELFISPDAVVDLWREILEAGKEYNVMACGLGARDSLRAGAVLPLSHQDIGGWKFVNTPWDFALPYNLEKSGFTKTFIGSDSLLESDGVRYTYPFAGEDLRKIASGTDSHVTDSDGNTIGTVLTCATDMAIGWSSDKIYSIASPDLPEGFRAKGISCGFVLVDRKLDVGTEITLHDRKRAINVKIVDDIRPARTARQKISSFL